MADNYDEELGGTDILDAADAQDEASDSKPSALPTRNLRKKNLHPVRSGESGSDLSALASFDFDSLIKKPEPAAAAPAKKGVLDSLADTAKDAGKAISNFIAPDKNYMPGSVMNDLPPQEPLANVSRAPVAPGVRRALEGQYDSATPEQRTALASRPGAAGDVFRQRETEYSKRTSAAPALDLVDPSAESRTNRYVDQGMDSKIAGEQGALDAREGVVGQTVGNATVSKFDFETAEKYAKDPFFSNPVIRGAVKGVEGYKQGVIGINQFVADMVGADDAAGHYKQMAGASEDFTKAIGDPVNYGQKMFEGAISSIAQQIPALIGGAVTGSEALVLGSMFAQSYGQNYSEGRAAGQPIDKAADRAAKMATFEVIGEKIGLGDKMGSLRAMLKGNQFEEAVKLMAKSSIKEVPGEQVTTLGQFVVDKQGKGYGIRREAELKDLIGQMKDTLVQTMMQGGIMTGGVQGAKMVADRLPQRQENPMPADGSVPETTQEPQSDIKAQIDAMIDPANPKDAVYIAKGTPVPEGLPQDVQVVERPEGTLVTNNPQKAQVYGESEHLTDDMMAQILGLPQTKSEVMNSGAEAGVVQARDAQGNVVNEAVTDGSGANEQAIGATVPEGGTVTTRTPEQAQQERAAKVAQESIVPGQQDSSIDDLLGGVKEVDENGQPVAPEAPVAPPQQQPVQAPVPPVETAPAPPAAPAEAKAKPVRKPAKPKAPKVEPVAQTPKESFAQKMGAQYAGESEQLKGNESKKLEAAAKKSEPAQVFNELAKSTSPTVRFVGEAAQKSSERYGQPLKLRVSDKEVNERVTRSVNRVIEDSQLAINTLDAMRSMQSIVANHAGKGLPTEVKAKMILAPGSHSGIKGGLTLGKVLRDNGITSKAGFDLYLKNEEKRLAPKESALRDNAKMRKVQADSVGGLHDPRDHTILVRRARAMREHVIAHEVTHALTSEAIDRPTDAQRPYVEALGRLYDHVKSVGTLQNQYGMQDMKEFIAEGFSNPDFQHALSQIKYEGSTAWEKFTQMIAKLLGMKHDNAFVEMMRIGEGLMDSTQSKSAIGNNSAADGSIGNVSMMRQGPIAGSRFKLPAETRKDSIQNALQDRFNRIKKVQTAVQQQGGTITSDSNIYAADERQAGASAAKVEWFTKYRVKPLLREMGKEGVDVNDVGLYMYASHAAERNTQIAKINPAMPDGGSGMTNDQAEKILKSFQSDPNLPKIQEFAKRLQDITKETQKVMLDGHLVDQAAVDAWNTAYQQYVPLKGFEKYDEFGAKQPGSGRGYDIRGGETRRSIGRESRAGNIVENIIMDHERALVRAEKNKVARALLRFVLQNKDDNLWEVNKVVQKGQLRKDPSPGHVLYKLETVKDKDRTITVKENGKEYYVLIKDKKMFEQLQGEKGALNMEGSHATFFQAWSSFNRFLTKMWTAYNPAFTVVNAIRDTTTAIVHGSTAVGPGFAAKVAMRAPTAIYAIWNSERKQTDKLPIGPNGPQNWNEWYQRYQEDGGKAGFYMFSQLEDKERELRAVFNRAADMHRGTTKRKAFAHAQEYLGKMEDAIMDANGAIENMNRVAAYRVAIEDYNMSREEAAALAKNLTVNFNRRGTLAPLIGSFYLFFNPAVQGTARMIKSWEDNKAMMSGFLSSMVAIGYMVAAMSSGDEDENGMPYWDKIPAYEKEKSIVISVGGGKRITLPMAYGYGFFVNFGYLLHDVIKGGRPIASASLDMLDAFVSHFVPIAYQRENPATVMVPSVAIPVLESMTNQKATGQPLMPDARQLDGSERPDSQRYWNASKGTMAQKVANWLNEMTGGDKFEGGIIDVSPETISNSVRGYLGGGGTFGYDFLNSIFMASKGETLEELRDKGSLPGVKGFFKGDNGKGDQAYFMKYSKEAVGALDRFKEFQNSDDPVVIKRLEKTRDLAELGTAVRSIQKAAGELRKQENAIKADTDHTEAEKKEALKEIEKQRTSMYSQFNAAMFKLERGKKD